MFRIVTPVTDAGRGFGYDLTMTTHTQTTETKMNTETRKQIADTILAQLGGRRFIMMTGAKNLSFGENGELSMKIGRNAKGVTHVRIALNAMDLYDVTYLKVRGTSIKTVATSEGIYNDMLREDFERETGLYTSL